MNSYARLNNIVYWIALLLWASALISAGVAAMNVFTTMDQDSMKLSMQQYDTYPAEEHQRLAASHIMEPIFATVDVMQFISIPLVLITLVLQVVVFRMNLRCGSNAVRAACLAVAAILFGYYAFTIAPTLNGLLRDWWTYAAAGDVPAAHEARRQFDEYHTPADSILKINLLLVLVAAGASATAFSRPARDDAAARLPRLLRS